MPRVKMQGPRFNPVAQRKAFNRLVAIGKAEKGIDSNQALGAMIGLSRQQFSDRWVGESPWKYDELCRLFRALSFSPERIAEAMGFVAK